MTWEVRRDREPAGLRERERRLTDLILAGVIGWSWPQYYMGAHNLQKRIDEILQATADEKMPWEN